MTIVLWVHLHYHISVGYGDIQQVALIHSHCNRVDVHYQIEYSQIEFMFKSYDNTIPIPPFIFTARLVCFHTESKNTTNTL